MINVDKLKTISEKPWFYPVALFLIGAISYEYALMSMGYYWADWEIVMFTKLNPALQFGYYAGDRPFPWVYHLVYSLVGSQPIGWHIVTLFIRWAGTLFFVKAITLIWPRYKKYFLWLGALLIVYPGFLQQLQAATKARHIMTLLLFSLSIYLMALAVKRPKMAFVLFPLSWIATFVHLFTTEYFSGLELIRPVLLWVLMAGTGNKYLQIFRRVAITSLPYLVITAFFFWARFVYLPDILETTNRLREINTTVSGFQLTSLDALLGLFNIIFLDFLHVTFQVWTDTVIDLRDFTFQRRAAWFAFGLGVALAGIFSFFHETDKENTPDDSSSISIFIVGFLSFILGTLPIWAIGRALSMGNWSDRFSLAPMLGATMMVTALVIWFVRPARQKIVLTLLLLFSIATQVWSTNTYRRDWETQLDYYWQLYWRAPTLQSGTAIFSFEQPSPSVTPWSDAGFAINVLYHYKTSDGTLPYWFINPENEYYFQKDNLFRNPVRNLTFIGNTSNAVAVVRQLDVSCLRVLDEVYRYDPLLHEGHDRLLPISNLSRIIPDPEPVLPDADIFGPEPEHTWCYFFQKADLARQEKDWDKVLALHADAQQKGFAPRYGAEYIPFIEAYAQTGDWQKAYDLTIDADKLSSRHKRLLCLNWVRLGELPGADMDMVRQVDETFSC